MTMILDMSYLFVSLSSAIMGLNIVTGEGSRNLSMLILEVQGTFSSYYGESHVAMLSHMRLD